MTYEIIGRLEKNNEITLLQQPASSVEMKRKENKKLHEVGELSFVPIAIGRNDYRSNEFVWQKLNYIHNYPCTGKWKLAIIPSEHYMNIIIALPNFI